MFVAIQTISDKYILISAITYVCRYNAASCWWGWVGNRFMWCMPVSNEQNIMERKVWKNDRIRCDGWLMIPDVPCVYVPRPDIIYGTRIESQWKCSCQIMHSPSLVCMYVCMCIQPDACWGLTIPIWSRIHVRILKYNVADGFVYLSVHT